MANHNSQIANERVQSQITNHQSQMKGVGKMRTKTWIWFGVVSSCLAVMSALLWLPEGGAALGLSQTRSIESSRPSDGVGAVVVRHGGLREVLGRGGFVNPPLRAPNMVRVVARHADGTIFYDYTSHNLRTNAGVTWQEGQMAGTTAAVANYIALSSTAITPSVSDTSLSGEITTNGLGRATGTVTYSSSATDLGSGTYTSGGTISGTTGQTCTLASFNDSCSGSTATVALTGSGTIAGGTPLTVTAAGTSCTSAPTSATLGSGTATCSGTATVSTALGIIPTYTVAKTFTATAAVTNVQSTALFNASSSGTEAFENTFSAVSLNANDTLTVTWTINF
jgi:hypothetical protein